MSESTIPQFSELLPPEVINMIGRLEFLARTAKVGSINGRHTSPHKGFSVEFAEHRQYVSGDDLRNLDWRVYGKSDRYYIKQYIEETNMRATILVDASGSMAYAGESASGLGGKTHLSKFEYARYLASALTYLLIRQQDAVGLVTFDEEIKTYLRPTAKPSQVRTILEALARTTPTNDTRCAATFHEIAERIPSRGLVIVISDLFDDAEAIKNARTGRLPPHGRRGTHLSLRQIRRLPLPRDQWPPPQHRPRHDPRILPRPGPIPSQIHRTHLRPDESRLRPRKHQNTSAGSTFQLFLAEKIAEKRFSYLAISFLAI